MFKRPTVTTLQWSIICFTYACNLSQTTIILPLFTHCKREEAKKEQQRLTEAIFKACFFTTKRHKKVANPLKGKGEVFWFLERVAVRVAEEKGVVLCRREEEKKRRQTKGVEKKRRQKENGCGRGFVQTRRREEEKEEEGCGCGFVQTEKKIRQKGEG
ncbi:hypothetical protein OIU85_005690 [Salix viminalis]|uniref:Uncharacterized protein n=1 Tax=Salix viminalis TaxID=40686 RepID=A0A9Q0STW0_SALVM|nr:hypothetical protein OIU85_005690 [Salix viminalis]